MSARVLLYMCMCVCERFKNADWYTHGKYRSVSDTIRVCLGKGVLKCQCVDKGLGPRETRKMKKVRARVYGRKAGT